MTLNTQSWNEKCCKDQGSEHTSLTDLPQLPASAGMKIAFDDLTKQQRGEMRKKLKEDLVVVQNLCSKLEARELQLKQSQSVQMQSNAYKTDFSVKDVATPHDKMLASKIKCTMRNLPHLEILKRPSFKLNDISTNGTEVLGKRTPKANQLYSKTDFVVGKDRMPVLMKSKSKNKKGTQNCQKKIGIPTEIRLQCKSLLNKLMSHKDGWVFNHPVDAVKLGLTDYHVIIKNPMDLGTIRGKLDRKQYSSTHEFIDDVRLTFSNAMTYNPPANDVHQMAIELLNIFEKCWEPIKEKLERIEAETELDTPTGQVVDGTNGIKSNKKSCKTKAPKVAADVSGVEKANEAAKAKAKGQKKTMTFEDKAELQRILEQLPQKTLQGIIALMKERNIMMCQKDNEIEVDLDSSNDDILWELYRRAKNSLRNFHKRKKAALKKMQSAATIVKNDNDDDDDNDNDNNDDNENGKGNHAPCESSSSESSSSDSGSSSDSDSTSSSTSRSDDNDMELKG